MHFSLLSIPLSLLAVGTQAMPATKDGYPSSRALKRHPIIATRGANDPKHANNTDNGLYTLWNCNWAALDPQECTHAQRNLEGALAHGRNQVPADSCTFISVGGAAVFYCAGHQEGNTKKSVYVAPGTLPAVWDAVRGNCGDNRGGIVGDGALWAAGYLDTEAAETFVLGHPLDMKL